MSNDGEWSRLFEILERVSHYFGQPFVLEIVILKKKETALTQFVMLNKLIYTFELPRIYIERIQREKANGATTNVGIHPSKVAIVKLKMDKDRKAILDRRAKGRAEVSE